LFDGDVIDGGSILLLSIVSVVIDGIQFVLSVRSVPSVRIGYAVVIFSMRVWFVSYFWEACAPLRVFFRLAPIVFRLTPSVFRDEPYVFRPYHVVQFVPVVSELVSSGYV
jgi:hypothetical protein